jgi:hypothetical protein
VPRDLGRALCKNRAIGIFLREMWVMDQERRNCN